MKLSHRGISFYSDGYFLDGVSIATKQCEVCGLLLVIQGILLQGSHQFQGFRMFRIQLQCVLDIVIAQSALDPNQQTNDDKRFGFNVNKLTNNIT